MQSRVKMEGYLEKMRNTSWPHVWQQRWFFLNGNTLSWSKEKDSATLGSLVMNNIEWIRADSNPPNELWFQAYQSNKGRYREFMLRAASESECQQWRRTLQRVNKKNSFDCEVEAQTVEPRTSHRTKLLEKVRQSFESASVLSLDEDEVDELDACGMKSLEVHSEVVEVERVTVEVAERGWGWRPGEVPPPKEARVGDILVLRLLTSNPVLALHLTVGDPPAPPPTQHVQGAGDCWALAWALEPGASQQTGPLVFHLTCTMQGGEVLAVRGPVLNGEERSQDNLICNMQDWKPKLLSSSPTKESQSKTTLAQETSSEHAETKEDDLLSPLTPSEFDACSSSSLNRELTTPAQLVDRFEQEGIQDEWITPSKSDTDTRDVPISQSSPEMSDSASSFERSPSSPVPFPRDCGVVSSKLSGDKVYDGTELSPVIDYSEWDRIYIPVR